MFHKGIKRYEMTGKIKEKENRKEQKRVVRDKNYSTG
jgi:hypothetical protein